MMATPSQPRSLWKWSVCGLLLLATMINYMDRLTLNQSAKRMMADVSFNKEGYGDLEAWFGIAFAAGSLTMGLLVDRINVYWVYPTMVALWSLAGAATGRARDFNELAICRVLLGFFEAANWPCALRTTQRLLPPEQRTLGNGILQSGAAIGAILTPQVVQFFLSWQNDWRPSFYVVGATGLVWVCLWLAVIRARDLSLATLPESASASDGSGWSAFQAIVKDRRFWALAVVVVCINLTWHFFRAWMPLFLQDVHNYTERQMNNFTSCYYIAADLGAWAAGLCALLLTRRGMSVHGSRMTVYSTCAIALLLSFAAAALPTGHLLMAVLLVIGFFALGLFPNYYSFSQELTSRYQGMVTGMLGSFCWVAAYFMQKEVGRYVERTGQYTEGVAIAGIPPLLGLAALLLLWRTPKPVSAPGAPAIGLPAASPASADEPPALPVPRRH